MLILLNISINDHGMIIRGLLTSQNRMILLIWRKFGSTIGKIDDHKDRNRIGVKFCNTNFTMYACGLVTTPIYEVGA